MIVGWAHSAVIVVWAHSAVIVVLAHRASTSDVGPSPTLGGILCSN